ncbi:mechanosensitive ion channel [Elizabethkingia argentiflava]|uniref:Mechanosensitive ion channel n=1 Tax=Elizabethkingia argenteiflava TaxID=2681556 RepID=A0A845PQY1_9FLAO|nr:mechanosensitive ion channel family protein [Elizabethkingia argenteiflava]NAW50244.1 mechanosensitive ion channel [Elizabethkingia argenteiflava]
MSELSNTKDFLQYISDSIHLFIAHNVSGPYQWMVQVLVKFIFLLFLFFLIDLILKLILRPFHKLIINKDKFFISKALRKSKITSSLADILALAFVKLALESVFYRHPTSFTVLSVGVRLMLTILAAVLFYRCLKALGYYYSLKKDSYRVMAFNAISQTVRIFGILIFSFIGISQIFGIQGTTILGSLGAITAVLVLVFRDIILGFVTGIHVATSRNLKVGDWVGIAKYNIEGVIAEISLLTTKIVNFDKTISTVPTYDLMSTEIKNYQVMTEGSLRRIKRSMIFNIKSFRFLTQEDYDRLQQVKLISDYIVTKRNEIESEKLSFSEKDSLLNKRQLTNIGVFRKYVENYLRSNPNIEQKEIIMVRHLEVTPQGLPLEIYCFTIYSQLVDYERVQSDIFDHLLVAVQNFELEVMQVNRV